MLAESTTRLRRELSRTVGHVAAGQEAMQPETVAASFVATAHRRLVGQAEPLLSQADLLRERRQITGVDGALAGALALTDREVQLPVLVTQLEGHVEGGLFSST
jgi:hypothetical protein